MSTAFPSRDSKANPTDASEPSPPALVPLIARSGLGGVLMGLANLVPGISGGTMLLAAGVYPRFIGAIGELSTFKFRRPSVVVLGTVIAAALSSIVLFAGPVKQLVVEQRWIMYSLFIGLTLGGVPVIWRLIRANAQRPGVTLWLAVLAGFVGMAALAVLQASGSGNTSHNDGFVFLLLAGIAGAAAMILPGVSGGYLLLVLGAYVPILAGIDTFKDALTAGDLSSAFDVGWRVILPVGVGVVVGVVAVSNLLRWLLQRFERPTLGVLLGLLLGAVVGLWPFQQTAAPTPQTQIKGQTPTATPLALAQQAGIETDTAYIHSQDGSAHVWIIQRAGKPKALSDEDLPTQLFTPTLQQAAASIGLILLGFAVTMVVGRLGQDQPQRTTEKSSQ